MSPDEPLREISPPRMPAPVNDNRPMGSSSIYRLAEEMIALREHNKHQHRLFEKTLKEIRDDLRGTFNTFAADTQKAYQQLRQEVHGEKRVALNLLHEFMDVAGDLEQIVNAKPKLDDVEAVKHWANAIDVEYRKVLAAVERHGIHAYDAVIGSPYNPALHERVASCKKDGLGPLLIAEQRERGYASQQPEFVLRRPKVVVSE